MELAFLLSGVGTEVVWLTNQKPVEPDEVIYSLEHKMLEKGVKVVLGSMLLSFYVIFLLRFKYIYFFNSQLGYL